MKTRRELKDGWSKPKRGVRDTLWPQARTVVFPHGETLRLGKREDTGTGRVVVKTGGQNRKGRFGPLDFEEVRWGRWYEVPIEACWH
jgi:hypothetical protein